MEIVGTKEGLFHAMKAIKNLNMMIASQKQKRSSSEEI